MIPSELHGLEPVGRLPDQLETVAVGNDRLQAGSNECLVVGDPDPGHTSSPPRGRRASTR